MRRNQQGMTLIGFIIAATVVGTIVYGVLRLIPVFLEYQKVESTLTSVQAEWQGQEPTAANIRNSIQKRLDIESVSVVTLRDFKVRKKGSGYTVNIAYSHTAPYIANVSFLVEFDKTVEIMY